MPVLGVSVQGEDALVVADVVATGVGDVGKPGAAAGADDEVADGGVGVWLVPGPDPGGVFAEGDVADILRGSRGRPMA